MDTITTIRTVIATLGRIQVAGKENLALLLGSINLLEGALKNAEAESEKEEKE